MPMSSYPKPIQDTFAHSLGDGCYTEPPTRRVLSLRSRLARIPLEVLISSDEHHTALSQEVSNPPQACPRRSPGHSSEKLLQRYPRSDLPKWKIPPSEWPTVLARVEQKHEPLRQVVRDYGVSYEAIRRVLKAARNLKN